VRTQKQLLSYNNLILLIPINNLKKKSYNINDLLNVTFSHWSQSNNESCEHCSENKILNKNEITLTKDIIIIHLILFSLQDDKVVKVLRKFNISTIPTTKVLIAGQSYKVMNAVFHNNLCIEEGHYKSICREGMSNSWIKADDTQIKKNNGLEALKIYTYFFYKKLVINNLDTLYILMTS